MNDALDNHVGLVNIGGKFRVLYQHTLLEQKFPRSDGRYLTFFSSYVNVQLFWFGVGWIFDSVTAIMLSINLSAPILVR